MYRGPLLIVPRLSGKERQFVFNTGVSRAIVDSPPVQPGCPKSGSTLPTVFVVCFLLFFSQKSLNLSGPYFSHLYNERLKLDDFLVSCSSDILGF